MTSKTNRGWQTIISLSLGISLLGFAFVAGCGEKETSAKHARKDRVETKEARKVEKEKKEEKALTKGSGETAQKEKESEKEKEIASLVDKEGRTISQRIQAKLPSPSPVRIRWALDFQGRKIVSLWFPEESECLDTVFILTDRYDLIAIERKTGLARWWTRLAGPVTGDLGFTPFSILLAVKNRLLCLERGSGHLRWQVLLPTPLACGPAAQEDKEGVMHVYLAGLDRRLSAYIVKTEVWPPEKGIGRLTRDDLQMEKTSLDRIWHYPSYGALCDRILYSEGKLLACDWAGYIYGINTLSGITGKPTDVWVVRGRKSFLVGPTLAGPAVIVPGEDQNVYCLSRSEGGILWRYLAADALRERAQIAVDPTVETMMILVKVGKKGPLIALPEMGGDPIWEVLNAKRVVARLSYPENTPKKRCVFAAEDDKGGLLGFYAQTGEIAWKLSTPLFHRYAPNTYDDVILATTEEDRILCAIERTP